MALQPGQMLNNRYRIIRLLGQGGFGAVYRAWDTNLNRPLAVKENLDTSPEAQRQFTREATVLANLSHPNLPRVTDHFILPGQGQYLVMDFVEGEDLATLVQRGGPVPPEQALVWVSQVADALIYLHSRQPPVVHRDIKPANIRITPEGQAMLVDFGLVKVYDPGLRTTLGARAVTPGYAPPEQYGQGNTDGRTDLYALGATLYNLLTGQAPLESVQRMSGRQMPMAHQLAPRVPESVGVAIERSMRLDPQQRFQNVTEFKAALTPVAQPVYVKPAPELYAYPSMQAPARPPAATSAQAPAVGDVIVRPTSRPPVLSPAAPPGSRPRPSSGTRRSSNGYRLGLSALAVSLGCLVVAVFIGLLVLDNQQGAARQTESARFNQTLEARVRLTSTAQSQATQTSRARATDALSISATGQAASALMSTVQAGRALVFGPKAGEMPHDPDNGLIESVSAGVDLQDFMVQARFYNPHPVSKGNWDYGFILRHEGKNMQYRFIVHSDNSWILIDNEGTPGGIEVGKGILAGLNVDEGGSNLLALILKGNKGYFYLNDAFVTELDLSERMNSGNVYIVTGMLSGDEIGGSTTKYSDFSIWTIP